MAKKDEIDISFEKGMAKLESMVEDLESEDLDLDKSLTIFEDGVKLARQLNQKLDRAEKKLEILLKKEDGQPLAQEFDFGEDREED